MIQIKILRLWHLMLMQFLITFLLCSALIPDAFAQKLNVSANSKVRQRISLNSGWRFFRYANFSEADSLIYDLRPEVRSFADGKAADARPEEQTALVASQKALKAWILPSGNSFIKDTAKRYKLPNGNPGGNFPFVQSHFNDNAWESVNLPHDWAIKGPFYTEKNAVIGGGMGRLPVHGVGWYRKKFYVPVSDAGKSIFLNIDGAMSYAMVWLNGRLVGGWPYGYNSWQVDLTPYLKVGTDNQLAIRVDNPPNSSRWYPGGGIYRNVWLVKTNPVHVGQWGTFITTPNVSKAAATIQLQVTVDNDAKTAGHVEIATDIFFLNPDGSYSSLIASTSQSKSVIAAQANQTFTTSVVVRNPKLWGPPPTQTPNRYVAVTHVTSGGKPVDQFETRFGIRDIKYDPDKGLMVNGEHIFIKGADHHHDLGALGTSFNTRAAERQLEILHDAGCNAIRMSHNPPAPEFIELCDRMGFLVMNEIFDMWKVGKTPLDFHLIFPEWYEQDLRAFVRRDRNHPSVIIWSFGNEVGEQYTDQEGARLASSMKQIVKEEDPTRPATVAMNYAKPDMPLPNVVDVISLNYQGEGIRNGGAYTSLRGISTPPLFPAFHSKFPDKMIVSSENASAFSSRGEYLFPVFAGNSAPIRDGMGGSTQTKQVSAYELYSADFGSSADKTFASMDHYPFVAGGFVWTGWDYLGEPTPYYEARSSYSGLIDLAGFLKNRYYLYQSYWRPDFPMAHILPHWNWADRVGQITPVHVFTSGDEAELFLNGKSMGRKKKATYEYRLRWDSVIYSPGELKVIVYKNGKNWAEDVVRTTGEAQQLELVPDRTVIKDDGYDLSFITVKVKDKSGLVVPYAKNTISFSIEGAGEIVATDNGNSADMRSFASKERDAFNGLCLVIVRSKAGLSGNIRVTAKSSGLKDSSVLLKSARLK